MNDSIFVNTSSTDSYSSLTTESSYFESLTTSSTSLSAIFTIVFICWSFSLFLLSHILPSRPLPFDVLHFHLIPSHLHLSWLLAPSFPFPQLPPPPFTRALLKSHLLSPHNFHHSFNPDPVIEGDIGNNRCQFCWYN